MTKYTFIRLIRIFISIVFGALMFSCEDNENIQSGNVNNIDSLSIENDLKMDTNYISDNDPNWYIEMRKNKYLLPKISAISFTRVNSLFDQWFADSVFIDSLPYSLKFYHKRYPDIEKYKLYYFTIHCYTDSTYRSLCPDNDMSFGLMIVYEPLSKKANVFCVEYNFLSDSETHDMNFSIDSTNTFHLLEGAMIGGEADDEGILDVEYLTTMEHFINVNNKGEIQVKSIERFESE